MKLKELLKKVTVQGDIRISIWDEMSEEETYVIEFGCVDRLYSSDVHGVEKMTIKYMFASPDGMLHIELDPESGKKVQR